MYTMSTRNRGTTVCQLSYQQPSERMGRPSHSPPPALCKLFLGHLPPSSGKGEKENEILAAKQNVYIL